MRAFILALVVFLASCSGGCGGLQKASGTQGIQYTADWVSQSTFLLEVEFAGMPYGSGTIWKAGEGYGVTAGHVCVNDGPGISFFARTPSGFRVPVRVLKTNDPAKGEDDLCVMTGDLPGASLDRIGSPPAYGEPVFYSGAPRGVYFKDLQPSFEGIALNPKYMAIGWAQGASGSPVYTRNGVVGVLVGGYTGTDIAVYVPVDKLDTFLKGL